MLGSRSRRSLPSVTVATRPYTVSNVVEFVRTALDAGTDHVRGMHAEGDAIAAEAERELQTGMHSRHAANERQSIAGRGKTSAPGAVDGRQILAKQLAIAGRQPAHLA